MELKLRTAEFNDLNALKRLFVETIRNTCSEDYTPEQIDVWASSSEKKDRWEKLIEEQIVIVAILESKLVGFGSIKDFNYIDFLYSSHMHQGMGIASKILNELEDFARTHNTLELSSDVSITAQDFFKAKGFKSIHKNLNHVKGQVLINYHMTKALTLQLS